jgi:hypothetical protein
METTVWLMPPWGKGEPQEVEARTEILVPMLVQGWSQCEPPAKQEGDDDVHR